MKFTLCTDQITNLTTDLLVIGVYNGGALSPSGKRLDETCGGYLTEVLKLQDFTGKAGKSLLLPKVAGLTAQRVLLVGVGGTAEGTEGPQQTTQKDFQKAAGALAQQLKNLNAPRCHVALNEIFVQDVGPKTDSLSWQLWQQIDQIQSSFYEFNQFKSKKDQDKDSAKTTKIEEVLFLCESGAQNQAQIAIDQAHAISIGMNSARTLANLPGNACTPSYLAEKAQSLDKHYDSLTSTILYEEDMENLGMGAFLSVSAGSAQPAKLITIEYQGAADPNAKPYVLVGKGITFDTGGISLKPGAQMDEMKYDMSGAAAVLGVVQAIAELKPALNLVVVVAAAENMPGSNATKPGDIVTSMSGKTIEILNTDAEGRLVLCDALSYTQEKFDPELIIDVATLTGACVMALGHVPSGLFSADEALVSALIEAGQQTGDRVWRMPLLDEYQEQLDSNFADMANIGGRMGGSITAACFLSRFTEGQRWAHIDIAGTAWNSGKNKGSTGRPVHLLVRFLLNQLTSA